MITITICNLIYILITGDMSKLSIHDQINSDYWIWEPGFYE